MYYMLIQQKLNGIPQLANTKEKSYRIYCKNLDSKIRMALIIREQVHWMRYQYIFVFPETYFQTTITVSILAELYHNQKTRCTIC